VGGGVVQLLPGDGRIGAALVASPQVAGVIFTGSTEVARLIQQELAERLSPQGQPVTLIAETGGQNAMIVDSSALTQQVVADVIASAFDSAGQRCSALRILCIQEEVADTTLETLRGAIQELAIGRTDELSADIGPVISREAQSRIEAHIDAMRAKGRKIEQGPLAQATRAGTFVAPTIIEIETVDELEQEVFGPVLHVVRFERERLGDSIDAINALGYGLTFGLHSRLEETIAEAGDRIRAGNLYINRNMIGAVVGVQPFGGHGLSGTGPKAGGPLYLPRLANAVRASRACVPLSHELEVFAAWLGDNGLGSAAASALAMGADSRLGQCIELPGPVGERNVYSLHSKGDFLLVPSTMEGLHQQMAACLATGNRGVIVLGDGIAADGLSHLPPALKDRFEIVESWTAGGKLAGVLAEGEPDRLQSLLRDVSGLAGPVLTVLTASPAETGSREPAYRLDWMLEEIVTSTNTTAAGGNATLMTIA
jgi:RHH-type proline utilization regulon transcriptional repressor/proline dehydrogenase/delta 1-pyrroline-5-carboxylate dehydrogenase